VVDVVDSTRVVVVVSEGRVVVVAAIVEVVVGGRVEVVVVVAGLVVVVVVGFVVVVVGVMGSIPSSTWSIKISASRFTPVIKNCTSASYPAYWLTMNVKALKPLGAEISGWDLIVVQDPPAFLI
jgi:hypothetical protein